MARALNYNPFRKENVEKLVQFVSQPELHIENFFDPLFSGDNSRYLNYKAGGNLQFWTILFHNSDFRDINYRRTSMDVAL